MPMYVGIITALKPLWVMGRVSWGQGLGCISLTLTKPLPVTPRWVSRLAGLSGISDVATSRLGCFQSPPPSTLSLSHISWITTYIHNKT